MDSVRCVLITDLMFLFSTGTTALVSTVTGFNQYITPEIAALYCVGVYLYFSYEVLFGNSDKKAKKERRKK